MAEQLPVREVQLDVRLVAAKFRLFQLAAIRSPTEDGYLQGCDGRVAQVAYSIGGYGEVGRVNSVEIIKAQRRQQTAPGGRHLVP